MKRILDWPNIKRVLLNNIIVIILSALLAFLFTVLPIIIFLLKKFGLECSICDTIIQWLTFDIICLKLDCSDFNSFFNALINTYPLFIIVTVAYKHGISRNNIQLNHTDKRFDYVGRLSFISITVLTLISLIMSLKADTLAAYNKDNGLKWFKAKEVLQFPFDQIKCYNHNFKPHSIEDDIKGIENSVKDTENNIHVLVMDKTGSIKDDTITDRPYYFSEMIKVDSLKFSDVTLFTLAHIIKQKPNAKTYIYVYPGESNGERGLIPVEVDSEDFNKTVKNYKNVINRVKNIPNKMTNIKSLIQYVEKDVRRIYNDNIIKRDTNNLLPNIHVHIFSDFCDDDDPVVIWDKHQYYTNDIGNILMKAKKISLYEFEVIDKVFSEQANIDKWASHENTLERNVKDNKDKWDEIYKVWSETDTSKYKKELINTRLALMDAEDDLQEARWKQQEKWLLEERLEFVRKQLYEKKLEQKLKKEIFYASCNAYFGDNVSIAKIETTALLENLDLLFQIESDCKLETTLEIEFYEDLRKVKEQNVATRYIDIGERFHIANNRLNNNRDTSYKSKNRLYFECIGNIKNGIAVKFTPGLVESKRYSTKILQPGKSNAYYAFDTSLVQCCILSPELLSTYNLTLHYAELDSLPKALIHYNIRVLPILPLSLSYYLILLHALFIISTSLIIFLSSYIHLQDWRSRTHPAVYRIMYLSVMAVIISFNVWYISVLTDNLSRCECISYIFILTIMCMCIRNQFVDASINYMRNNIGFQDSNSEIAIAQATGGEQQEAEQISPDIEADSENEKDQNPQDETRGGNDEVKNDS